MNQIPTPAAWALGLAAALFMVAAPVSGERYIVEPMVETIEIEEQPGEGFSQAELDQMLAPIALYPDVLLSQVLIAATYPLEIVEAARWSRRNPHLEGEEAVAAVADRDWDPSVKALVAFPELLEQLSEDLEWTRDLGDAMLFQEAQVMDSIQFLRARADAAGSLEDSEYVRVVREEKTIIIKPARTHVVHVPYYDPWVVYGPWWRPAYPPVVWVRPSHYYYGYPGFYWSSGIHVSHGFFFSSFYWPQRHVYIVHTPRFHTPPRHRPARAIPHYAPGQRWKHNPLHRRGVAYRHPEVRERFSGSGTTPRFSSGSRSDRDGSRWAGRGESEPTGDRGSRTDRDRGSRDSRDRASWNERDRDSWAGADRSRPSRSVPRPSDDGERPDGRRGGEARVGDSLAERNLDRTRTERRDAHRQDPPRAGAGSAPAARPSGTTSRPDVSRVQRNLSEARGSSAPGRVTTRPQASPSSSEARSSSTQPRASAPQSTAPRASAPRASTPRATAPRASTPRATAPRASAPRASTPRAAAPQASRPQASTPSSAPSRTPQSRPQSSPAPAATPAPSTPSRATNRSRGRAAESQATSRGSSESTRGSSRSTGGSRDARRPR